MKFGLAKGTSARSEPASGMLSRHSSGFDQFCNFLQTSESQSILDVSGASQANVSFLTGMGHRISSLDMLAVMEECFGADFIEGQQAPAKAQRFLDQVLTFPDETFSAALLWDTFQFLSSPVIEQAVAQLFRVMRPGGAILAFFNADEKLARLPVFSYRIQDRKTLIQVPRGSTQRNQYFPNRAIEKLFDKASALKFFLTRGSSREVIVKR